MKFKLVLVLIVTGFFACQQEKKENKESVVQKEEQPKLFDKEKYVIAYVAGWKDFKAEDIPVDKLTHINYAFGTVIDGVVTEGEGNQKRDSLNYVQLHKAKELSGGRVKLLGSIGGWLGCKGFHDAVKTPEGVALFTKTSIEYIQRYNLDGIDYDWEYPALEGAHNPYGPEDKENFIAMLKSVRDTLDKMEAESGKHYITSIASGGFDEYIDVNDIGEAAKHLDYVNIMTYDFKGGWDTTSGHHTNLMSTNELEMSADRSVKKHVEAGVPINKLVMGIAFYGRSWKGIKLENKGLYQQARTGGGGYSFSKIDSLLSVEKSGFEKLWDSAAVAPYLYNETDSIFLSYEDEMSVKAKCDYVDKSDMLGVMFWELSEDTEDRKLLEAIDQNLK